MHHPIQMKPADTENRNGGFYALYIHVCYGKNKYPYINRVVIFTRPPLDLHNSLAIYTFSYSKSKGGVQHDFILSTRMYKEHGT